MKSLILVAAFSWLIGGQAPQDEQVIVQVRGYYRSSTVDIVAWAPDEPDYGLRASVRRDGELAMDHRFYVSSYYLGVGFFYRTGSTLRLGEAFARRRFVEMIAPHEQFLELTGISRDIHNCFGWPTCSPFQTRGARIPDSLLRQSRDSLAVRFYDSNGAELILTLRREVIDPYLAAVDSVTAALRKS
jgi:hypothetical protein